MRKYTTWLTVAAIVQLLTAAFHSLSLFAEPQASNATEQQLIDLMKTYVMDMGAGFHHSMSEIVTALSACFTLLCLFAGLNTLYLLKKKASVDLMQGLLNIQLLVFAICFGLMAAFTFLPPIMLTGLIFLCLIIARVLISKRQVV